MSAFVLNTWVRSTAPWLCAATMCFIGTACTVETRTYLEPSAERGDVGRLGAGGCAGATPSFIFFHPPNLDHVNVVLGASQTDQLMLLIGKFGSSGFERLFHPDESARIDAWLAQPLHVSAVASAAVSIVWQEGGHKTVSLDIPVREKSLALGEDMFRQGIPLDGVNTDRFAVDLPSLSFEGNVLDFPRIRFIRVRRMLTNPINC